DITLTTEADNTVKTIVEDESDTEVVTIDTTPLVRNVSSRGHTNSASISHQTVPQTNANESAPNGMTTEIVAIESNGDNGTEDREGRNTTKALIDTKTSMAKSATNTNSPPLNLWNRWTHRWKCPDVKNQYNDCELMAEDVVDAPVRKAVDVLDKRWSINNRVEYLIQWHGLGVTQSSWESEDSLDCPVIIIIYWESEDSLDCPVIIIIYNIWCLKCRIVSYIWLSQKLIDEYNRTSKGLKTIKRRLWCDSRPKSNGASDSETQLPARSPEPLESMFEDSSDNMSTEVLVSMSPKLVIDFEEYNDNMEGSIIRNEWTPESELIDEYEQWVKVSEPTPQSSTSPLHSSPPSASNESIELAKALKTPPLLAPVSPETTATSGASMGTPPELSRYMWSLGLTSTSESIASGTDTRREREADVEYDDDKDEYVVEDIRAKGYRNGRVEYLIKWQGLDESYNSWEVKDTLIETCDCQKLIHEYELSLKSSTFPVATQSLRSLGSLCAHRSSGTYDRPVSPRVGSRVLRPRVNRNEFLSNLATIPLSTINSLQDIVDDDRQLTVLIEKTGFAYNDNYPALKYKNYLVYDLNSLKFLEPIIDGTAVLIADEPVVEDLIYLNPTLSLHKSRDNSMLMNAGVFLFVSEFLSNLATIPLSTINSLQDIVDDNRQLTVFIETMGFAYNIYLKDKYPQLKYKNFLAYDLDSVKFLEPIIDGTAVLINDEQVVEELLYLNPTQSLHKSRDNSMLMNAGVFVRKGLNPHVKHRFKQK
ncbi:unnamed protein product, partial [Oppiella nova]